MDASQGVSGNKQYLTKATDIAIRLLAVAIIIISCYRIISPFVMAVAWGAIIAIALYTPFEKLKSLVGGRSKLAGGLFILLGLALIIVPTILLTDSIVEGASGIAGKLEEGKPIVPPPSEAVKSWPVIGESTYRTWSSVYADTEATLQKMAPQLKDAAGKLAAAMAGLGGAVVLSIFSIVIAGILLINSAGGGRTSRAIARSLGGEKGVEMVDMAGATIRSVVKGVLLVAAIQAVLSAIGMYIAGVPGAGFWALVVLIVAIIQLPPILILGPIAAWLFSTDTSTGMAIFFLIYAMVISGSDGFLKPLFLGRGVEVPMLVILIGAIGGMLRSGVIGLFVGAVILAIGYQLIKMWMDDTTEASEAADASAEPAS